MEQILEERNDRLDRDEEAIISPHIDFKINTTDLIFVIKEIWSVKEKVTGNERYASSYTHQGLNDYRSTRRDLHLVVYLESEPYIAILPAAMFKGYRPP
jgi:hypothetical protein